VARLRERTFSQALRQEVEFVEKGEGDVLSRMSVDTSIVGERCVPSIPCHKTGYSDLLQRYTKPV
jgi:hypothetical protein